MLYRPLATPDRSQTQLAFKLRYYPRRALNSNACKFIWNTIHITLTKAQVIEHLNADRTAIFFRGQYIPIVWQFNNIPTEGEWNKYHDSDFIDIEYRKSALIPGKYVAIFSFSNRPNSH
jgi:hypothetical protein